MTNNSVDGKRGMKILATGQYLPGTPVLSDYLDHLHGFAPGTIRKKVGVRSRHVICDGKSQSWMGAQALKQALDRSDCTISDIDCIIAANGTFEQPLPCTASCIQSHFGPSAAGIPCFDIDATCLSFPVALETAAALLSTGRYRTIAVVSSEVASVGLNWNHVESAGLFGDAAAAAILRSDCDSGCGVIAARMTTHSVLGDACQVIAGGTAMPGYTVSSQRPDLFRFAMDGPRLLRATIELGVPFIRDFLESAGLTWGDFSLVVPHQGSPKGLRIMRRQLGVPSSKWFVIVEEYGNCIAASIPLALHQALDSGLISTGDRVLLLGSGAGLSFCAMVLQL